MTAADYADAFIHAAEIQDDPWQEPGVEYRESGLRMAAACTVGGLWGAVFGTACWWSYQFVTVAPAPAVIALAQ